MELRPKRQPLRTYSALLGGRSRAPSTYEICTTGLLYGTRGFETELPLRSWYERNQRGAILQCDDWERFADPRQTTYFSYTAMQAARETFVDGVFESMQQPGYEERFSPDWMVRLDRLVPVLRFPLHGLQMAISYIGSMAPSGRIAVACLFQAADELRKVQHMAYRMGQLRSIHPAFGVNGRTEWERSPEWQPLRELIERILTTYDWSEALVALNLCLKPELDRLICRRLAVEARRSGDPLFAEILRSLEEDCRWHRSWSEALVELCSGADIALREKWSAPACAAISALDGLFDDSVPGLLRDLGRMQREEAIR